jgi:hypothetical protein
MAGVRLCCVAPWSINLEQAQSDLLERLQKRVIRIIYELPIIGTPYMNLL